MATGKQGFVRSAEPQHSVSVQRENEMQVQASLTAMYVQAVPGLPSHPQAQPTAMQDATVIPLSMPLMYANQALPLLTLHIASGTALQQQRPETPASSPRPKSAGKHVCPHCGRDCLKPSVLEKHLRCHTGERPYPCATCGISFKTQSNLYKHKRTQAHARLSSESSVSAFSSQESTEGSREICSSPSLELREEREDLGDTNKTNSKSPAASTTKPNALGVHPAEDNTEFNTERALCKAAVVGLIVSPAHGQQEQLHDEGQRAQISPDSKPEAIAAPPKNGDGRAPHTPYRIPLQRQEALFAKLSRGKTQNHDSTDSGFSESGEHHLTSSLGDSLHNSSLESMGSMELQKPETSDKPAEEPTDSKSRVSLQEKQKLEERISKLISENSVLVDDKHMVNVRPRKTVLSKQGSIDLPMPYTYKDSFHFEMRSSKHQVTNLMKQDGRGRAFYSSMPTQHSTSLEHAPLTRSSSLPFSVSIPNNDGTVLPYQTDNIPLSRRCSAGHIYPFKSVDQHPPSHRLLVRQVAVDCLSATEGSPGEKGSHSSLNSEGDCTDTATESAAKKCRKKKAQKFAYNKWYMYGGGTFKKLYNTEEDNTSKSKKSTINLEQTESQGVPLCQQKDNKPSVSVSVSTSDVRLPPAVSVLTAQTSSQVISSYVLMQNSPVKQPTRPPQPILVNQTFSLNSSDMNTVTKGTDEAQLSSPMPSERKKQKTDDDISVRLENKEGLIRPQKSVFTSTNQQINVNLGQSIQSECGDVSQRSRITEQQKDSGLSLNRQASFTNLSSPNQRQLLFKRHSSPMFMDNVSEASGSSMSTTNISSDSPVKPSFLPKYQLKIPSCAEGMSYSCINKPSLQTSSSQKPTLQNHPKSTSPSAPQSQSDTTFMSSGQVQHDTAAVTSVAFIEQNNNAQSQNLIYTSTSISLTPTVASSTLQNMPAQTLTQNQCVEYSIRNTEPSVQNQPLQTFTGQVQDESVTASTKDTQIYIATTASVLQNSPAPSLLVARQQPGPTADSLIPACQTSVETIPLEIGPTAFQGAKDTFYVQTADLQIVMQLISDEQLAMIEPQIEKQDHTPTGSHSTLSKVSGAGTIQTSVSQEGHKQCSGDTGTKQCVAPGIVKKNAFNKIPDITTTSFGSTVTEHNENITKSVCSTYLDKRLISSSCSKTEHFVPVSSDSSLNRLKQCKPSYTALGNGKMERSTKSYLKQRPSEDPSAENSTTRSGPELKDDRTLKNYSPFTSSNMKQSSQENTVSQETSHTFVVSLNKPAASLEAKSVKALHLPEISRESHHSVLMTAQQHKSLLVSGKLKSVKGEMIQKTECTSEELQLQPAPISSGSTSQAKLLSTRQSCTSSVPARLASSGSVLTSIACQPKPLKGACCRGNLKYATQENVFCTSKQLPQQDCSTQETEGNKLTNRTPHKTGIHFVPHTSMSKCTQEENVKQTSGEKHQVIQDPVTGPPVNASLQSSMLQQESGTGSSWWIPQETKIGGADVKERVVMSDTTHMGQEKHSLENIKEDVTFSHEVYQTALESHPNHSQQVITVSTSSAQPDTCSVSGTATPAICGATSLARDLPPLTQRACTCLSTSEQTTGSAASATVVSKLINHSNKAKEKESLKSQERFTSLATGLNNTKHFHSSCGHLLAHPLLVNAIQKEVQKETQKKNQERCHSKTLQAHMPLPEHKDRTPNFSLSNDLCTTSYTESCQLLTSTPEQTYPSFPNPRTNSGIHSKPICASTINPIEPTAPTCQWGCSFVEIEERSSSSDDEGKLVIELE